MDEGAVVDLIVRRRRITGMSAVLLPWTNGEPDWKTFEGLVDRTAAAGLVPAVNMDTGFGQLLSPADRDRAIAIARGAAPTFVAGIHPDDSPGDAFAIDRYVPAMERVRASDGVPILFTGHALAALAEEQLIAAYREIGAQSDMFYAFELGAQFSPTGRVLSLDGFRELLDIASCIGLKHSSLERVKEWDRLRVRDQIRPDFTLLTGNDLAIDMVMYGSDYLLGLSAFAPDAFAVRDALWTAGDRRFYELNDVLQYLGQFAFRPPVPAYRHSAAMFLKLQGWVPNDEVPEGAGRRPSSDVAVLEDILDRLRPYRS